jgi:hypothetical protein
MLRSMFNEPKLEVTSFLFKDRNWFRFPIPLLQMMDKHEAILLAYLINYETVYGEWFYCRAKTIEEKLNYSLRRQSDLFRLLKEKEFIKTKKRNGIPPVRLIQIQWWMIFNRLGVLNTQDTSCSNTQDTSCSNRREELKTKRIIKPYSRTASQSARVNGFHSEVNKSPLEEWADACAKKYKTRMMELNKFENKFNIYQHWHKPFLELKRKYKTKEITRVLDYHLDHFKNEHHPHPTTPRLFAKQFERIQEHANGKFNFNKEKATNVFVTPEIQEKIVDKLLLLYQWPKDSSAQLPSVVQLSYTTYVEFRGRFHKLDNRTYKAVVAHWTNHYDFILDWFEWVNEQIIKWDEWNGNLSMFTFRYDHKHFIKMCSSLANEYGEPWTPVLELLKRKFNERTKV